MARYLYCLILFTCLLTACGGSAKLEKPAPGSNHNQSNSSATAGGTVELVSIYSSALKATMGFDIYLPPGYSSNQHHPVLYSLYGYGGNQHSMLGGFMALNKLADELIASGKIKPLIIVVPDYKNSFGVNTSPEQGVNSAGGTIGRYEDYLIHELIPYVDMHYASTKTRDGRFIEGYSMGGFAALHLGFLHPELFSKIAAHSAALWDYSTSDLFTGQRDWLYPTPALRAQRDPFLLATTSDLRNTYIYLDVGLGDSLHNVNDRFYRQLLQLGISAEWHSYSGGHNTNYWNGQLNNYFEFFNK